MTPPATPASQKTDEGVWMEGFRLLTTFNLFFPQSHQLGGGLTDGFLTSPPELH